MGIAKHKLLPERERPMRRVSDMAQACTVSELLAALIGGSNPIEVTDEIIKHFQGNLFALRRASADDLANIPGIGAQNAARIKAALELGVRLAENTDIERLVVHSPADIGSYMLPLMNVLEQEQMRVVLLDTRNKVIDVVMVYQGSVNSSQIRVGELFKDAIKKAATAVIIVHNHPSGDPAPSPDDVAVTRAIVNAGKLLDLDVLDHIIIGRYNWVSLKERGLGFSND